MGLVLPMCEVLRAEPGGAAPTSQPARSAWNVRDHIPVDKFMLQAHRGAGELAPENTIEAFELGWKLGCIPEADVRTTSDGVIVAFHDNNFARVVKDASPELRKKGVKDLTWEELSKLDVGSWKGGEFVGRRVSRMRDVFAVMKGVPERRLYLDIKQVDLSALAREVNEYGVASQVILATSKYEQIVEWNRLVPDAVTLLWMGGTEAEITRKFEALRRANFEGIRQLQIHAHLKDKPETITRDSVDPFKLPDRFLIERGEELRSRGILFQSLPFGGSSPEIYWKLLDLGLMSLATDHPEVTWKAIRDYYRMKP